MIPNHHNYLFEKKLLYNFPKRELVLRTQQGAQVRLITHLFKSHPKVWSRLEDMRGHIGETHCTFV